MIPASLVVGEAHLELGLRIAQLHGEIGAGLVGDAHGRTAADQIDAGLHPFLVAVLRHVPDEHVRGVAHEDDARSGREDLLLDGGVDEALAGQIDHEIGSFEHVLCDRTVHDRHQTGARTGVGARHRCRTAAGNGGREYLCAQTLSRPECSRDVIPAARRLRENHHLLSWLNFAQLELTGERAQEIS